MREYFLARYLELHGERTLFPGSVTLDERMKQQVDPLAEQFVSLQVDQYIEELERKLGAIKSTVHELETVRHAAVSDQSTDAPSTRARLRELAEDVGERAGDLFNMVAVVAIDLRAKNDVARPASSGSPDFLGNELKFLQKQVGKAEERLRALFLQPTHTVDLEELQGDNVLTELKSIEQVSKDIKKKSVESPGRTDMAE